MADKPVLFSAPMVQALLDGRKTQTRRVLKPQPSEWKMQVIDITKPTLDEDEGGWGQWVTEWSYDTFEGRGEPQREIWRPLKGLRYAPGDRLYVREHWKVGPAYDDLPPRDLGGEECILYLADKSEQKWGWDHPQAYGRHRPSIHMPRWASRLTLIVTDVRVQRLWEISEEDAKAEGVNPPPEGYHPETAHYDSYGDVFAELWNSINGPEAWDANPWVAAYSFRVIRANIDSEDAAHG